MQFIWLSSTYNIALFPKKCKYRRQTTTSLRNMEHLQQIITPDLPPKPHHSPALYIHRKFLKYTVKDSRGIYSSFVYFFSPPTCELSTGSIPANFVSNRIGKIELWQIAFITSLNKNWNLSKKAHERLTWMIWAFARHRSAITMQQLTCILMEE